MKDDQLSSGSADGSDVAPKLTFVRMMAAAAILGLVIATIGTGLNASQGYAGMNSGSGPGSPLRATGMILILLGAVGFLSKSVFDRNAPKLKAARDRAIAEIRISAPEPRALPMETSRYDVGRPFRIRFLLTALRISGVLLMIFATLVLAASCYSVLMQMSYGYQFSDFWIQFVLMVLILPAGIVAMGFLMFGVAEILNHVAPSGVESQTVPSTQDAE